MFRRFLVAMVAVLTVASVLAPATAGASNSSSNVNLLEVTVTVENLAPENGTAQTPVWVGIHDGSFDLYDRGVAVTPGLESLAEDGATASLSAEFAASGAGVDTTIASDQGIPPLLPGESGSFTFFIDAQRNDEQFLSYASMILPSNDAFVANGNPTVVPVIDGRGRFVPADFVVAGSEVLDAGSEVNDELAATTAFFGQTVNNTGTTEGAGVELHPGFIPNGRILSEARFSQGDFTADGYETLRISTEARRADRFSFARLDGSQTVPAVDTDARGFGALRLNRDGSIRFNVGAFRLDGLTVAHIHLGAPGETGPVAVDLIGSGDLRIRGRNADVVRLRGTIDNSELVGPLAGLTTLDLWAEIQRGNAYINLHTEDAPAGEIRADLN